mgnify:CR=1 FL=1
MENQSKWPGKITSPSTVTKQWQIRWFGFRCLVTCIKGNLSYGQFQVDFITWNVRINDLEKLFHRALWPNGDRRDDSVLGLGILHHGQLKSFVGLHHHMENQSLQPGKIYLPTAAVTKQWQIWWLYLPYLVSCIINVIVGHCHRIEKQWLRHKFWNSRIMTPCPK